MLYKRSENWSIVNPASCKPETTVAYSDALNVAINRSDFFQVTNLMHNSFIL